MTYSPPMDTLPALLADLPAWFWDVPHVSDRYPGAVPRSALRGGGNCHLFAYEVLAHFGRHIPDLRSDELWRDTTATVVVLEPQPLDLVLLHDRAQAWGAHVGVVCGPTEVVHLSKEVGRPAVWTFEQFAATPRFAQLIGFKRPL
ncbi:MAG: Cell wall-associated hydrolase [Frankiales bacterium]|nr:Cell wall-associated hydrolase [Frankiales bacterium]